MYSTINGHSPILIIVEFFVRPRKYAHFGAHDSCYRVGMKIADCPVRVTADVLGGKWKPLILLALKGRQRRFNELRRLVPEASHKVLTQQLRELERSGIVARTVYQEKAPRVEYAFSEYGASLRPILEAMAEWSTRHRRRNAGTAYSG
jgi:DNA-binding HxlR family transcriptional regulator